MKERDNNIFYEVAGLQPTPGIEKRSADLEAQLNKQFPGEPLKVTSITLYDRGIYGPWYRKVKGLPTFYEVRISHCTGTVWETITVWSPLAWNDRFMGCPGGGTATGGDNYLTRPDNTSRGMTLPKAVLNGFTGAMTDAGNRGNEWALDKETGVLNWERIENWRARSTHFMTLIGKAVAEILHDRPVKYSYLHGGSGGGRQCLVEAQEFPEDYDGIWASCPAINWPKFLPIGLWPVAVMNSLNHVLPPKKIKLFMEAAQNSIGGKESYYARMEKVEFDPYSLVGQQGITKIDAQVMDTIWKGPHRASGERMWHAHRPGVHFWNVGIPVGAFYYALPFLKPKPFFLSVYYGRWVTANPKDKFEDLDLNGFEALFDRSCEKFAAAMADNPDLSAFVAHGGKLMIDHGIDDPLIPVDGTIDYCNRVKAQMDTDFLQLYINPGDGHGSCNWHSPGIPDNEGMTALINWVEQGTKPQTLRTVQVNSAGATLRESTIEPYHL